MLLLMLSFGEDSRYVVKLVRFWSRNLYSLKQFLLRWTLLLMLLPVLQSVNNHENHPGEEFPLDRFNINLSTCEEVVKKMEPSSLKLSVVRRWENDIDWNENFQVRIGETFSPWSQSIIGRGFPISWRFSTG